MFLAEALVKKNNIENRIKELKDYLFHTASDEKNKDSSKVDTALTELYNLLDEYQKYVFLIARANRSIEIEIGKSKVTVSDAVKIRRTLKEKMKIMNDLILACKYNNNSLFSIFELIKNRNKLMEECDMLNNIIKANDWKIKLGN